MAETKEQRVFDAYETTGIVVPGAALLFGLWLLFPSELPNGIELKDISLGTFGLFAVAAFCAGHLVQAPGNLIESALWWIFGRPTERLRRTGNGLSQGQRDIIPGKVRTVLGFAPPDENASDIEWKPVIRSMASAITCAGRSLRLEKFNATYGLHRGLATSMLLIALVAATMGKWMLALAFAAVFGLALFRATRFAEHYATELWVEFLRLTPQSSVQRSSGD